MRRLITWCVVGAVAALVLTAGIDALRGGGEPEPAAVTEPEPPTTSTARTPEAWIAEAAPAGIWVYRADGSGPGAVRIPVRARDVLWEP